MDARYFQRIELLYHEASEKTAAERADFLNQACAGDETLRKEVESLLDQSGDGVLDRPVWQAVGTPYDGSDVMDSMDSIDSIDSIDSMIGRQIARFVILDRLGEGGMGAVYRARDQHLDRDVALKVLLPEAMGNADRRRRFMREAKAASGLNHPNIVHVYDIDEVKGELFIAMEYVAGKTLAQAIDHKGMPLREVLRYAVPMADALAKAHAAGIVHRDLKPSNVMITAERTVKVLDFGLAKWMERGEETSETALMREAGQTREGTVMGTAAYMSPEQAEGKPVDGRSDIFSFGAVLYEMLAGRRAFPGATRMATISAVLRDEPKPVSEIRETVPGELERIIARCLRKDPDRRFQHMEDLRVALEEVKEESESGSAVRPIPARGAGRAREKWIGAAVAVTLLALAAVGTWKFGTANAVREGLETVQVTTVPGLAIGASFSPDAKQIAFSSNRNGWFELYVRPSEGTGSDQQITTDWHQATEPAWSPDGRWIAYHSVGLHGVWVVPAGGGTPRQVTTFGSTPAWSPDGRQLAFRSYEASSLAVYDWPGDGESTIWTVAADGSNLQQVTQARIPPGQHADPSWSPDGKRVIFATLEVITMGFRGALFTVDVTSGEIKPVPLGDIWGAANPVYAPDGKGVYFAGRPKFAGSNGLYYSSFSDDPKPVELCRTRQAVPARITVSRDGRSVAFTRMVNASQIWLTDTSGKGAKPLYQDLVVRARMPNFSPDGARISYQVQSDDSTLGIWLMNADGTNPTRVAPELGNASGASWDARGTGLTCNFFAAGTSHVTWISLADGSHKVLLEGTYDMLHSHVTPDAQDIIYDFGSPRNIWKRPLAGGLPKQLTFGRQRNSFPAISWDGKWIVYEVTDGDDTQIAVMDRDGGQQKLLTSGPGKRFSHSFASDNRRIAYAGYEKGVWNLHWIDRITGESRQFTNYTAYGSFVRAPAWRPNAEQVAYEYSELKGNIERLQLRR